MKKAVIAIMLVVFLLSVMVPAVFAAAPNPRPPNDNMNAFGLCISDHAHGEGPRGAEVKVVAQKGPHGASTEVHILLEDPCIP